MADMKTNTTPPKRRGPIGDGSGPFGGGPMGGAVVKAKDFKGSAKKLLAYMDKYKPAVILVLLLAVLSTVFTIVGPKILGNVTTELFSGIMNTISGSGAGINFSYIHKLIWVLVGFYIVSAGFSYLQGFVMSGVSMKITYRLRKDISFKINALPLRYFDNKSYGEVLSHITNDVDAISQSLNQSITQIITSVTSIIGVLIMMLTINWQMTLIAICVLPVSLGLIMGVVKKSQVYFQKQQQYLGHVNGHIEEMYGSHTIVKAFNGEEQSVEDFDVNNKELYNSGWKSQFLSGMMMPIMNFVGNLGYVVVCIVGGYFATQQIITVGNIQAFISYMRQFTQPIAQVANISNVLQQTMAAAERVFEFLGEEEEEADAITPVSTDDIQGSVLFAHVHFGYNPEKTIINDFSAVIEPGQKIAIVGPTGAGKTTMVKLLMRFYDVNEGAILVDGLDLKQFSRNDLRGLFGMVLQDTWLYNATIMDNIRYGNLSATEEEVIAAAKTAQVHHFVKTLPDGYNMTLNEEASNVSQGQKQLLTIARAVLSNPKILILDEATSSVDTRTELLIQKAMDNLMKGRTSFIIAHRLSTIRDANMILVMNNGDIVEQGNHDELMAAGGFYEKLYNSQFESQG